jgi:hypothetical protein
MRQDEIVFSFMGDEIYLLQHMSKYCPNFT